MKLNFREALLKDKEYILNANREINILSGLNNSTLDNNIDKDLFEDKICNAIIAEDNNKSIGFILYSYVYWANCGRGIYLSQAYVNKDYRSRGVFKMLLSELETREKECNFITNFVGAENEAMLESMEKLGFDSSDLVTFFRKIGR